MIEGVEGMLHSAATKTMMGGHMDIVLFFLFERGTMMQSKNILKWLLLDGPRESDHQCTKIGWVFLRFCCITWSGLKHTSWFIFVVVFVVVDMNFVSVALLLEEMETRIENMHMTTGASVLFFSSLVLLLVNGIYGVLSWTIMMMKWTSNEMQSNTISRFPKPWGCNRQDMRSLIPPSSFCPSITPTALTAADIQKKIRRVL